MYRSMWSSVRLKHSYNIFCSMTNSQQMSTGASRFKKKKGINRSIQGLNKRVEEIEEINPRAPYIFDNVEGMESDFFKVGDMYDSHKSEHENLSENRKLQIVKQKYFKTDSQPNFLTWAEKEQIRYLHSNGPDEWSADKLAQSFPASETIIRKVIKSRWNPEDSRKMLNHDKSVDKNWKAMLSGKLEIESCLKTHLMKFAKREQATFAHTFMEQTESRRSVDTNTLQVAGEFSNIIQSYTNKSSNIRLPNSDRPTHSNERMKISQTRSHPKTGDTGTYVLGDSQKTNEKHVTLDRYREEVPLHDSNSEKMSSEKCLAVNEETLAVTHTLENRNHFMTPADATMPAVNLYSYQESIKIPKDKWKQGGTFKVGECYYDDDGEFLYRVPGMK